MNIPPVSFPLAAGSLHLQLRLAEPRHCLPPEDTSIRTYQYLNSIHQRIAEESRLICSFDLCDEYINTDICLYIQNRGSSVRKNHARTVCKQQLSCNSVSTPSLLSFYLSVGQPSISSLLTKPLLPHHRRQSISLSAVSDQKGGSSLLMKIPLK